MINSDHKVLYLLAACQKYEMTSVQSSIRAEVKRGEFPAPKGVEAFLAYAIARAKGLTPEMESAARQTLECSMTFEVLGEGLQSFEGSALHDLAIFRMRVRDNLITCLKSFLNIQPSGPSSIWVGCPAVMNGYYRQNRALPTWLSEILLQNWANMNGCNRFTLRLDIHSRIRQEYLTALQKHSNCIFCSAVLMRSGLTYCAELENKLAQAQDKVFYFLSFQVPRDLQYFS
jgi:hypothetical protein